MPNPNPPQFVQIERRSKLSREEFVQLLSDLEKRIWENLKKESVPFGKLSGRTAESILTAPDAPVPDCQTCGACCVAVPWVDVKQSDPTAPENFWNVTIQTKIGEITVSRHLRRSAETGNCLALAGAVGESVGCLIYENRPDDCRKFEAGSDKCHALRRAYGIEPALSEMETMAFMMRIFLRDEPVGDEKSVYLAQIRESETIGVFEIEVFFKDRTSLIIHRFKANEESWLESEFSALSLAEAKNLAASPKKVIQ